MAGLRAVVSLANAVSMRQVFTMPIHNADVRGWMEVGKLRDLRDGRRATIVRYSTVLYMCTIRTYSISLYHITEGSLREIIKK